MYRTRFAPSPSGFLHLGNARTALFAYLAARRNKGQFLLRIEDTDLDRIVAGSEASIIEDLKWLGLLWDEGPDRGGPLGPYHCSERFGIYQEELKRFQKVARVCRCFCSADQLEQDRKLLSSQKKILKYVGRCLAISEPEATKKASAGESFVWRLHVPAGPDVTIHDLIRGEVTMARDVLGDFILMRAQGSPVFLFANAVDDALQEITHVIRGEDHLSNTFRQVLIYQMLGYKEPTYAHLPMIGGEDGGKLSKREGSLSIRSLREEGYIPAGILNYLALLGWSPGDTAVHGEKFSLAQLQELFGLDRVSKGRALFDENKLRFLNQAHLNDLSLEALAELAPCRNPEWKEIWVQALNLVRKDAHTAQELYRIEDYLRAPNYAQGSTEVLKREKSGQALARGLSLFQSKSAGPVEEGLKESLKTVGQELGLKGKDLYFPFRVALTGSEAGPELLPLAKLLGAQEVQKRLAAAIAFSGS